MNLESDKRLNIQLRLDFSSAPTGESRQAGREDIESLSVVSEPERPANTSRIMEEICERANLKEALRQVRGNKGSAGVDRMTVDQLGDYLKQHWPAIREQLLNGTYEPKPVRRVEIPKPDGGGVRKLGIPTVLDRFIPVSYTHLDVYKRQTKGGAMAGSVMDFGCRPTRTYQRAPGPASESRQGTKPRGVGHPADVEPRSNVSMIIMRPPQHGQGCEGFGGSSGLTASASALRC